MFSPLIFSLMCRPSKIDVSTFEDRWLMCRLLKNDVSTFGDRCVDLRRSMIETSKINDQCEIMLLHNETEFILNRKFKINSV